MLSRWAWRRLVEAALGGPADEPREVDHPPSEGHLVHALSRGRLPHDGARRERLLQEDDSEPAFFFEGGNGRERRVLQGWEPKGPFGRCGSRPSMDRARPQTGWVCGGGRGTPSADRTCHRSTADLCPPRGSAVPPVREGWRNVQGRREIPSRRWWQSQNRCVARVRRGVLPRISNLPMRGLDTRPSR